MRSKLRARIAVAQVWLPGYWTVGVAGLGIVAAVVGVISDSSVGVLGLALLGVSVMAFVIDARRTASRMGDLFSQPAARNHATIPRDEPYTGFELIASRHGVAVTSDALNDQLARAERLAMEITPEPYRLPRAVRWAHGRVLMDAYARGRRDFNDKKVRLISDPVSAAQDLADRVSVQPTRFLFAITTNDLAEVDFWSREKGRIELSAEAAPLPEGRLPSLSRSCCSNHVGVDTLAFTRGGQLVLAVQSVHNAQSPGLLASSGSGSADWADLSQAGGDFLTFLRRAMARELAEECGLRPTQVRGSETQILGFARFVHRGGKPQFVGVTPIDAREDDLRRTRQERRYVTDHLLLELDWSSPRTLCGELREVVEREQVRISVPLQVNIELLVRWLEHDPDDRFALLRSWFRGSA